MKPPPFPWMMVIHLTLQCLVILLKTLGIAHWNSTLYSDITVLLSIIKAKPISMNTATKNNYRSQSPLFDQSLYPRRKPKPWSKPELRTNLAKIAFPIALHLQIDRPRSNDSMTQSLDDIFLANEVVQMACIINRMLRKEEKAAPLSNFTNFEEFERSLLTPAEKENTNSNKGCSSKKKPRLKCITKEKTKRPRNTQSTRSRFKRLRQSCQHT